MGKDEGIQLDNKRHDWELQVAVPLVWCVMLEPSRRTLSQLVARRCSHGSCSMVRRKHSPSGRNMP